MVISKKKIKHRNWLSRWWHVSMQHTLLDVSQRCRHR